MVIFLHNDGSYVPYLVRLIGYLLNRVNLCAWITMKLWLNIESLFLTKFLKNNFVFI